MLIELLKKSSIISCSINSAKLKGLLCREIYTYLDIISLKIVSRTARQPGAF